jgi:anti-sigma28 factor (negative regulator of flagellin synthesis)
MAIANFADISNAARIRKQLNNGAANPRPAASASQSDTVLLFRSVPTTAQQAAAERAARLSELRSAIFSRSYHMEATVIADRMLERMLWSEQSVSTHD